MTIKTLTVKEFTNRAKLVHRKCYNYTKTNYKNMHTKIEIVCSLHGSFFQTPANHLAGKVGCKTCNYLKKKKALDKLRNNQLNIFLIKANKKFKNKYDYDEVNYINKDTPVKIICPIHGDFSKTPANHLKSPFGCNKCRFNFPINSNQFIKQAISIHGDKYNYDNVSYVDYKTRIEIKCLLHGSFFQKPTNHLYGQGCKDCADINRGQSQKLNTKIFIKRAIQIHKDKFSYKKTKYINNHTPVVVICKIHGEFTTNPNNHTRKKNPIDGCKKCANEKLRKDRSMTLSRFIELANDVHNYKYKYHKAIYVNARKKILIECPYHGNFNQGPGSHISGIGCPDCGNEIISIGETIYNYRKKNRRVSCNFYLLKIKNDLEEFLKIGITTKGTKKRFSGSIMPYKYEVLYEKKIDLADAYELEQKLLSLLKKSYHYYPRIEFGGRTECFRLTALNKIKIKLKEEGIIKN